MVDDGRGDDDLLHLVVEIKGYRGEDAKEKKSTMDTYWIPRRQQPSPIRPLGLRRVHRRLPDRRRVQPADRALYHPANRRVTTATCSTQPNISLHRHPIMGPENVARSKTSRGEGLVPRQEPAGPLPRHWYESMSRTPIPGCALQSTSMPPLHRRTVTNCRPMVHGGMSECSAVEDFARRGACPLLGSGWGVAESTVPIQLYQATTPAFHTLVCRRQSG